MLLETLDKIPEHERVDIGLPLRFLYSHSVELMLKAFLRIRGFSGGLGTKRYGHDLHNLFSECNNHDLVNLYPECASLSGFLQYLKEGHTEYQFRYWDKSFCTVEPSLLKNVVSVLAEAVVAESKKKHGEAELAAAAAEGKVLVQVPSAIMLSLGL